VRLDNRTGAFLETPRECGQDDDLHCRSPSSLRRARSSRCSLSLRLWVYEFPMTRAHARLLGPCFKTGPVSARNKTTADRDASRPSVRRQTALVFSAIRARDACAPRSDRGTIRPHGGRPMGGREPRSLPSYRGRTPQAPEPTEADSGTTARRVRPLRPTGRGVILREKCTHSEDRARTRRTADATPKRLPTDAAPDAYPRK